MQQTHQHRTFQYVPFQKQKRPPKPPNKAKQAHTGHTFVATSYPQAVLGFAFLTSGSWGKTGKLQQCAVQRTFIPRATKQKSSKPGPAKEAPPLRLTAPHLLPFSPLSPEEGTSRKRLGKPLDFILLHPLNRQKTKENRYRRQYFQLATKSSTRIPPSHLTQTYPSSVPIWGICKRESLHTKGTGFFPGFFCAQLRKRTWELCS